MRRAYDIYILYSRLWYVYYCSTGVRVKDAPFSDKFILTPQNGMGHQYVIRVVGLYHSARHQIPPFQRAMVWLYRLPRRATYCTVPVRLVECLQFHLAADARDVVVLRSKTPVRQINPVSKINSRSFPFLRRPHHGGRTASPESKPSRHRQTEASHHNANTRVTRIIEIDTTIKRPVLLAMNKRGEVRFFALTTNYQHSILSACCYWPLWMSTFCIEAPRVCVCLCVWGPSEMMRFKFANLISAKRRRMVARAIWAGPANRQRAHSSRQEHFMS
jgi:hypothetical protein